MCLVCAVHAHQIAELQSNLWSWYTSTLAESSRVCSAEGSNAGQNGKLWNDARARWGQAAAELQRMAAQLRCVPI